MPDEDSANSAFCGTFVQVDSLSMKIAFAALADGGDGKDCTDEARSFNYEKIMYGQFVDGMDAFHKDFRNMEYPIDEAIRIVRDQINGRSQEDIERELVAWRHCHASKSECGTPARPLMPN